MTIRFAAVLLPLLLACEDGPGGPTDPTTTIVTTTAPATTVPATTTATRPDPTPPTTSTRPPSPPPPTPPTPPPRPPAPPPPPTTTTPEQCPHIESITFTGIVEQAGQITVSACFESAGGEMDGQLIGPLEDGVNEFIYKDITFKNTCQTKTACIKFTSTKPHLLCSNGAKWKAVIRTVWPGELLGATKEDIACP